MHGCSRQRHNGEALARFRAQAQGPLTCSGPHARPKAALTPPARLAAVRKRLDTMLEAVKSVRAALDDLYGKLSDEQKAQFETIGPLRATTAERVDAIPRFNRSYRW